MQYCLDPLDLRLRTLDGSLGLVTLGYRTLYARLRTLVITAALIKGLLGDNLLPDKLLPAFEIGFGGRQNGITLRRNSGTRQPCLDEARPLLVFAD